MAAASVTAILPIDVALAWGRIGNFGGWHTWNPRIAESVLSGGSGRGPVGAVRSLLLSDGSRVQERLERYDDRDRSLAYSFVGNVPFPVRDYLGQVRLRPVTDGGTFVEWWGEFDADEGVEEQLRSAFVGLYTTFIGFLGSQPLDTFANLTT